MLGKEKEVTRKVNNNDNIEIPLELVNRRPKTRLVLQGRKMFSHREKPPVECPFV